MGIADHRGSTIQGFNFNTLQNIPAGSASEPSLAPSGDPDTGFFFPAADTWAIANAGSETIRGNSSGYVGIGETNPQTLLHIDGGSNGANDGQLRLQSATYPSLEFYSDNADSGNRNWRIAGVYNSFGKFEIMASSASGGVPNQSRFAIDRNGLVGLNTSSPLEALDVNGDAVRIRTSQTPASASATGNQGTVAWDASYIYVCTATDTWKRAALATW